MEWRKRWGIAVALVALALTPHWRSVLLQELPLPEGYLALLEPSMARNCDPLHGTRTAFHASPLRGNG